MRAQFTVLIRARALRPCAYSSGAPIGNPPLGIPASDRLASLSKEANHEIDKLPAFFMLGRLCYEALGWRMGVKPSFNSAH
jgi:hypothetical protein